MSDDQPGSTAPAFDPLDPAVQQCPHATYAAMRAAHPVVRATNGLWFVTTNDLVKQVAGDPGTFSSMFGSPGGPGGVQDPVKAAQLREAWEGGWAARPTLLTNDPPSHTRYRRLVSRAFSPVRVRDWEPTTRTVAEELVDAFPADGVVEFVGAFAVDLPVRVITHALGVPDARRDDVKRWSDASVAAIGTVLAWEEQLRTVREIVEFQQYFAAELDRRRAAPRADLLTELLQAELEPGDGVDGGPLDTGEILAIVQQLLVAGNETTTKLLADALLLLAEHPGEWERLRSDPAGRAPLVVEEALRLAAPVQGMFRIAVRDTEIGGCPVPRGSAVVPVYASANRDERVFPDPDRFDPDRPNAREHLSFGRGIHLCLGAALARMEASVALEVLATRLSAVAVAPDADLRYASSFILRGLERLDLAVRRTG